MFNLTGLRAFQKQAIYNSLKGHDLLILYPTGHGKSLAFQWPAFHPSARCTIVISPLLALMADQVSALNRKGLDAAALSSATQPEERAELESALARGDPPTSLLYVSPELICQPHFRRKLQHLHERKNLSRLVIDEAHCAVEWGLSFREEYGHIGELRRLLPGIPFTAVTGTASAPMQSEIVSTLKLDSRTLVTLKGRTNRANAHYSVRYIDDPECKLENLTVFLRDYRDRLIQALGEEAVTQAPHRGCGLIYCRARLTTVQLAEALNASGFPAQAYHAGLPQEQRDGILKSWREGDPNCSIVVATIAFGMGIDKPDVRFVIHFELPNNIEEYAQQAGRAGRDNKACLCVLYYSSQDSAFSLSLANKTKNTRSILSTQALVKFAENTQRCRHLSLAAYFDTDVPASPDEDWCDLACDICKTPEKVARSFSRWKGCPPPDI